MSLSMTISLSRSRLAIGRRDLPAAGQHEPVAEAVLGDRRAGHLRRKVIVPVHDLVAGGASRLRSEADDEDRDQKQKQRVNEHRLRRFPHLLEHGGRNLPQTVCCKRDPGRVP